MIPDPKRPRLVQDQNWNVLDDDRELDMLAQGLSLADTLAFRNPKAGPSPGPKRRTLDDMRRLSEQIKANKIRKE